MTATDGDTAWFLAQLKPNAARLAQRNLQRQGFDTFLPLEYRAVRAGRRFVQAERPLFPGYMFLAANPVRCGWQTINSTLGVSRLVCFGTSPTRVPAEIIAHLRARCDANGVLRPPDRLEPGQNVRLTAAPFADAVAEIESLEPDHRVRVLMTMMGARTRVLVHADQLRAV